MHPKFNVLSEISHMRGDQHIWQGHYTVLCFRKKCVQTWINISNTTSVSLKKTIKIFFLLKHIIILKSLYASVKVAVLPMLLHKAANTYFNKHVLLTNYGKCATVTRLLCNRRPLLSGVSHLRFVLPHSNYEFGKLEVGPFPSPLNLPENLLHICFCFGVSAYLEWP